MSRDVAVLLVGLIGLAGVLAVTLLAIRAIAAWRADARERARQELLRDADRWRQVPGESEQSWSSDEYLEGPWRPR